MTGIAAMLKKGANYSTHAVGKWDAGMATPQHTPRGRGFDTSLVYYNHENDYWTRKQGGCAVNSTDPEDKKPMHISCTSQPQRITFMLIWFDWCLPYAYGAGVDLWSDDGPAREANASAGSTSPT
jgi:hypothetical protein